MYRVCIALVDAAQARLFTFERVAEGLDTREELVERTDFVNPNRRRRLASEARLETSLPGPHAYTRDDRRGDHLSQADDKFARMAMAGLRELIDEHPTQRVVICAAPRMLGRLRAAAPGLLPVDVALDELPCDLVERTSGDVRGELASRGLLPQAAHSYH